MLESSIKRLQTTSNWISDQKLLGFPIVLNIPLWLVLYILSLRFVDVILEVTYSE